MGTFLKRVYQATVEILMSLEAQIPALIPQQAKPSGPQMGLSTMA